ncbi:hypothetical protein JCM33774_34260 [Actinophytocola sp. KF-1]
MVTAAVVGPLTGLADATGSPLVVGRGRLGGRGCWPRDTASRTNSAILVTMRVPGRPAETRGLVDGKTSFRNDPASHGDYLLGVPEVMEAA